MIPDDELKAALPEDWNEDIKDAVIREGTNAVKELVDKANLTNKEATKRLSVTLAIMKTFYK